MWRPGKGVDAKGLSKEDQKKQKEQEKQTKKEEKERKKKKEKDEKEEKKREKQDAKKFGVKNSPQMSDKPEKGKDARHIASIGRKFKKLQQFTAKLEDLKRPDHGNNFVDFGGWGLDEVAARDLAEVLKSDNTITKLRLCHNKIGDTGLNALAASFEKNRTLTSVNLEDNDITRSGVSDLTIALENNVYLLELVVAEPARQGLMEFGIQEEQFNQISKELTDRINEILAQNKKFKEVLDGKSSTIELSNRRQETFNAHLIDRFPNIVKMNLRRNALTTIPSEISKLLHLEVLDLSDNKIDELPQEIPEKVRTMGG
eukprot:TRINITY_DN5982_c0_g1_i1.p1 TRINITY_DN5982_c0_g1~~TRINITY_DN5982_c0_g1_i1.p1  ORF type:complete len:315 (+),score=94.26 TRINITY_DN5982_c0_g1_i1:130-1074(+)